MGNKLEYRKNIDTYKKYVLKHKEKVAILRKTKGTNVYWSNVRSRIYWRARVKNREFNLTFKDVRRLKTSKCVYCNVLENSMTIDRKDNNLGYIKTNCVSACAFCNRIKGWQLSYEEMKIIGKAIKKVRKSRTLPLIITKFSP